MMYYQQPIYLLAIYDNNKIQQSVLYSVLRISWILVLSVDGGGLVGWLQSVFNRQAVRIISAYIP